MFTESVCQCPGRNDTLVSSQITSPKAQLKAPLSPSKQPGSVSTLTYLLRIFQPEQACWRWPTAMYK